MSYVGKQRVKQIRRKDSTAAGGYLPIAIGTDGILVDMVSQLDLEEEIRLGGNHYVEIRDTDTQTEILEWYYTEPKGTRTVQEMIPYVTYSVKVIITNEDETIIINLYKGDISEDKILHQKVITIKQESSTFTLINEEVDG